MAPSVLIICGDGLDWLDKNKPELVVTDPPVDRYFELGRICDKHGISLILMTGHDWLAPNRSHPGEKLTGPYRRVIRQFQYETVVDPFVGTGAIGVAAILAGKNFIGIDNNSHWAEYARSRINAVEKMPSSRYVRDV